MYVNFLVYIIGDHANDANILGRSVHTIKKNTEALVIASREIGLEVNADKTKYMVTSRDQNAGRNHDIKTDNSCFENSIQEENKCRLKSQNAWYHSMQNTIYKTAHLNVFTDYWMYPVSLFASSFSRSKQKSTYTCCLREAHSALKEKCCQYKQLFRCSAWNCFITATI